MLTSGIRISIAHAGTHGDTQKQMSEVDDMGEGEYAFLPGNDAAEDSLAHDSST